MRVLPRWVAGIVAAGAVAAAASCANSTESGAASSTVAPSATAGDLTSLCHRETGANTFTRILVETAVVSAHLMHGDGRPGRLVPGQPDKKFSPDCAVIQLVAVTIGFVGLKVNGAPFTTLQESGFTVDAKAGPWEAMTAYGRPQPSIIFRATNSSPPASGEIQLTADDGGLFVFSAVDLYSSTTTIPHTITGRVDSVDAFTILGTVPNTFGAFATVPNPNAAMMIDTLIIRIVNPAAPCCPNPSGLDNIVLKR